MCRWGTMDTGRNDRRAAASTALGTTTEESNHLWLSHHHDHQRDRCVAVNGTLLCRRCAVLYPATLVVAVLIGATDLFATAGAGVAPAAVALLWLCPAPAMAEWVGEHTGRLAYVARRQVATTALASVAVAIALVEQLRAPFSAAVLAPLGVCTAIGVAVAVFTRATSSEPTSARGVQSIRTGAGWEESHLRAEERRAARLHQVLASVEAVEDP